MKTPADNHRGPRFMQEALSAIHQADRERAPVSLEYGSLDGSVGLYCRLPDELSPLVTGPIRAKYPDHGLETLENEAALLPPLQSLCERVVADLVLSPDLFPILRHTQFEDVASATFADPIDAVLRAVEPDERTHARIEMVVRPTSRRRHRRARRAVEKLNGPRFRRGDVRASFYARTIMHPWLWPLAWLAGLGGRDSGAFANPAPLDTTAGRRHEREDDVQAASDKVGGHLFDVSIRLYAYAPKGDRPAAERRLRTMFGALGSFTVSRLATFRMRRVRTEPSRRRPRFLLSHEELATLWHPPTATVGIAHLQSTEFTEIEAPAVLTRNDAEEPSDGTVLGRAKYRDSLRLACLGRDDRRRHLYIVGKTGMGKTTLLENQILADISAGRGVGLIDPHGDLADRVIAATPTHRTNDIVVLDPSDADYAVAFNPLWCFDPDKRDLVADDVLSAFAKVYDLSHAPRLKDVLRNALYVLVEKRMTLLNLLRLLEDDHYRRSVVVDVEDEVARLFWHREFPSWSKTYRTEAFSAVQNKIRPFLMNKKVRAIVGQRGRPLNFRRIMDDGKVLVVNLSKGKLGEDNASLLGALVTSAIQQAAMSRADVPESQRPDYYLFVDEFQNFTTGSFATILSEARKYGLNLTVAHQYLGQLDRPTLDAVFGNVGSLVTFQVGSDDAEPLARQLAKYPGQIEPRDLTNLPKYTAYARLLVDGLPTPPFSLSTLPPSDTEQDRHETVRAASRRQFAQPLAAVRLQLSKELLAG